MIEACPYILPMLRRVSEQMRICHIRVQIRIPTIHQIQGLYQPLPPSLVVSLETQLLKSTGFTKEFGAQLMRIENWTAIGLLQCQDADRIGVCDLSLCECKGRINNNIILWSDP